MSKLGKFAAACAAVLVGVTAFGEDEGTLGPELLPNGSFEVGTVIEANSGHFGPFNQTANRTDGWLASGVQLTDGTKEYRCGKNPPDGTYFICLSTSGWIKTDVTVAEPGDYQVSFLYMARSDWGGKTERLTMTLGDQAGEVVADNTSAFKTFTATLTLAAGTHTLKIQGDTGTAANSAAIIDCVSLRRVYPSADSFLVSANRFFGVQGEPNYTQEKGLASDNRRECSAPATMTVGQDIVAVCQGWRLYRWDDEAKDWALDTESDEQTLLSCVYVHGATAGKLVWQWKVFDTHPERRVWPAKRVKVTLPASSMSEQAEMTDIVVPVRISPERMPGFSYGDCAAEGADISFAADEFGVNPLDFEIDTWNPNGESLVWVKLPKVPVGGMSFYFGYGEGNPGVVANDPQDVWSDYIGVWHMNEIAGDAFPDSTSNAMHAVIGNQAAVIPGVANGACSLSAGNLAAPDYDDLYVSARSVFALSGWFKTPNHTASTTTTIAQHGTWAGAGGWYCQIKGGEKSISINATGTAEARGGANPPGMKNPGEWNYFFFYSDGTKSYIYANGNSTAAVSGGKIYGKSNYPLNLGATGVQLDEFRLRKDAGSLTAMKMEYNGLSRENFLRYDAAVATPRIAIDETVAQSRLALAFPAQEGATQLRVFFGEEAHLLDVNGWDSDATVADVEAGGTAFDFTLPPEWGETGCKVAQFCLFDDLGYPVLWSPAYVWQSSSMPVVEIDSVDVSGGDVAILRGRVVSFEGESCTVTALFGAAGADPTDAWPGATATLTAPGSFALTLAGTDPDAAAYVKPGVKQAFQVRAEANGETGLSGRAEVTPAAAATFSVLSNVREQRTLRVTVQIPSKGAGEKATVRLLAGTDPNALEPVGEVFEATADGDEHAFVWTFDDWDATYYWQISCSNRTAGGTADWTTGLKSVQQLKTPDDAVYRWKGGIGAWNDPAMWQPSFEDCRGVPDTVTATAQFDATTLAAGSESRVAVDRNYTVRSVVFTAAGAKVSLARADGLATQPTIQIGAVNESGKLLAANGTLEVDGVTLSLRNDGTGAGVELADGETFVARNGGSFVVTQLNMNGKTGAFEAYDGGALSVWSGVSYGAGDYRVLVDNASYYQGNSSANGNWSDTSMDFVLTGKRPSLTFWESYFRVNQRVGKDYFTLCIPEGGYELGDQPIIGNNSKSTLAFPCASTTASTLLKFRIDETSPFFKSSGKTRTYHVLRTNNSAVEPIVTNKLALVQPKAGYGELYYVDADGVRVTESGKPAAGIDCWVKGQAGFMLIIR